jgi:hypothetical protein
MELRMGRRLLMFILLSLLMQGHRDILRLSVERDRRRDGLPVYA